VDPNTIAIRLRYIRDYIQWRFYGRLLKLGARHPAFDGSKAVLEMVLSAFSARIPHGKRRNVLGAREGLSPEARAQLKLAIEPRSANNPWTSDHARIRNALIVMWLLTVGVRRGELLGLRTTDVNFQRNEVLIARRADDPNDPRKYQPNAKTSDRLLPLDNTLAEVTRQYIMGTRRAIKGARKHEFLFVANGSGAPLTQSGLNKIFVTLRQRCPDLPENLTPHVLRHTWNDIFSEMIDEKPVPEELEKKARSHLMGWSETSKTAATYTRRHTKKKAREATLALQEKMMKGGIDDA
jgi:integrase